jgi:hypothetical protein
MTLARSAVPFELVDELMAKLRNKTLDPSDVTGLGLGP